MHVVPDATDLWTQHLATLLWVTHVAAQMLVYELAACLPSCCQENYFLIVGSWPLVLRGGFLHRTKVQSCAGTIVGSFTPQTTP